jgi:hypothetical protein
VRAALVSLNYSLAAIASFVFKFIFQQYFFVALAFAFMAFHFTVYAVYFMAFYAFGSIISFFYLHVSFFAILIWA